MKFRGIFLINIMMRFTASDEEILGTIFEYWIHYKYTLAFALLWHLIYKRSYQISSLNYWSVRNLIKLNSKLRHVIYFVNSSRYHTVCFPLICYCHYLYWCKITRTGYMKASEGNILTLNAPGESTNCYGNNHIQGRQNNTVHRVTAIFCNEPSIPLTPLSMAVSCRLTTWACIKKMLYVHVQMEVKQSGALIVSVI